MSTLAQYIRDRLLYGYGFLTGRAYSLPSSLSELYALLIARLTSAVSLPLPLLSVLVYPIFGGYTASINILVFYLVWSATLANYGPLAVEIYGTLFVRFVCFLLPALAFLAFDCVLPKASQKVKVRGERHVPRQLGHQKLLEVIGVAILNVSLSVALQAGLDLLATRVFHARSLLKTSAVLPLPWSIAKDIIRGLVVRGTLHYFLHRFLLHTYSSPLRTWHLRWQHSAQFPFSLVATYDHPVNHVLVRWLPAFLPACFFRFHVLTWLLFSALTSLEDLFVYSGYTVLPFSIILPGMARRTTAHFESLADGKSVANFGHLGLSDLVFGTTCQEEVDIFDDLKSEAAHRALQQRIDEAVQKALAGLQSQENQDGDHAISPIRQGTKYDDAKDAPVPAQDEPHSKDGHKGTDVEISAVQDSEQGNTKRRTRKG